MQLQYEPPQMNELNVNKSKLKKSFAKEMGKCKMNLMTNNAEDIPLKIICIFL